MSARLGRPRLEPALREAVLRKTLGLCWYCGGPLAGKVHLDHQKPRSRGGKDDWRELVPCCSACNLSKGAMTLDEYRAKREAALPDECQRALQWLEATCWFCPTQADEELASILRAYMACIGTRRYVFYGECFNIPNPDYCI